MPNLTVTFWTSKSVFSWLLFFFISIYLYISVLVLLNVDIMPAAGAPNLHLCPALPCTVQESKFCVLRFLTIIKISVEVPLNSIPPHDLNTVF